MALRPDELVVVIGPRTTAVLDVNTVEQVLSHIVDHVVLGASTQTTPSADDISQGRKTNDRLLRFFSTDGEEVELRLETDWSTFCLEPTGRRIPLRRLAEQVYAALETGRPDVDRYFDSIHLRPPELPPPGSWAEQLDALHAMDPSHQPTDIRGWFHNFFVHGLI
jgi:hypothetical protein